MQNTRRWRWPLVKFHVKISKPLYILEATDLEDAERKLEELFLLPLKDFIDQTLKAINAITLDDLIIEPALQKPLDPTQWTSRQTLASDKLWSIVP